jgi:hypothetical protein
LQQLVVLWRCCCLVGTRGRFAVEYATPPTSLFSYMRKCTFLCAHYTVACETWQRLHAMYVIASGSSVRLMPITSHARTPMQWVHLSALPHTDSDKLKWSPNHLMHCCSHVHNDMHCARVMLYCTHRERLQGQCTFFLLLLRFKQRAETSCAERHRQQLCFLRPSWLSSLPTRSRSTHRKMASFWQLRALKLSECSYLHSSSPSFHKSLRLRALMPRSASDHVAPIHQPPSPPHLPTFRVAFVACMHTCVPHALPSSSPMGAHTRTCHDILICLVTLPTCAVLAHTPYIETGFSANSQRCRHFLYGIITMISPNYVRVRNSCGAGGVLKAYQTVQPSVSYGNNRRIVMMYNRPSAFVTTPFLITNATLRMYVYPHTTMAPFPFISSCHRR